MFLGYFLKNSRVYFAHLVYLIPLNLLSVGYFFVCEKLGNQPHSWINLLAPTWFSIGSILVDKSKNPVKHQTLKFLPGYQRYYNFLLFVSAFFSVYHFSRVGLTIFLPSVETDRFLSLGQSGLLGIPSRVILFLLPALTLFTLINWSKLNRWPRVSCLILFIVVNFLSGFKGALVGVLIVVIVGVYLSGKSFDARYNSRVVLATALAVIYATWSAGLYITFQTTTIFNIEYIVSRLTIVPALPQWVSMNESTSSLVGQGAASLDLRYFLLKYFGIGSGAHFAFDQIISSLVYQTPRRSTSFIVPVTTGGVAYLLSSLLWWVVPVTCIGIGYVFTRITVFLKSNGSFQVSLILCHVFLALTLFMSNGAGVYLLINNLAIIVLLQLIYLVSSGILIRADRSWNSK